MEGWKTQPQGSPPPRRWLERFIGSFRVEGPTFGSAKTSQWPTAKLGRFTGGPEGGWRSRRVSEVTIQRKKMGVEVTKSLSQKTWKKNASSPHAF